MKVEADKIKDSYKTIISTSLFFIVVAALWLVISMFLKDANPDNLPYPGDISVAYNIVETGNLENSRSFYKKLFPEKFYSIEDDEELNGFLVSQKSYGNILLVKKAESVLPSSAYLKTADMLTLRKALHDNFDVTLNNDETFVFDPDSNKIVFLSAID